MSVQLGQEVKCVVTGLTGTVTQRIEKFNGSIQFAVQPKNEDGRTVLEATVLDHQYLEVIGDGLKDKVIEHVETDIKLGQELKDKVSDFRGIAMEKAIFINGCVYFWVVPKSQPNDDGKAPVGTYLSVERLEVVGDGLLKSAAKPSVKSPGGPSRSVKAASAIKG